MHSSTKSYKSYGKRKTHTTTHIDTTNWDEPTPPRQATLQRRVSISSDDTEQEEVVKGARKGRKEEMDELRRKREMKRMGGMKLERVERGQENRSEEVEVYAVKSKRAVVKPIPTMRVVLNDVNARPVRRSKNAVVVRDMSVEIVELEDQLEVQQQFGEGEDADFEEEDEEVDELDSSIEIEEVKLVSPETEEEEVDELLSETDITISPIPSSHSFPSSFAPLLALSPLSTCFDFTAFVHCPPTPFQSTSSSKWRKIGEASYSEVFAYDDMVVKIIPICDTIVPVVEGEEEEGEDVPYASEWDSVRREVEACDLFGGGYEGMDGFVQYQGMFVVQGKYPDVLLAEWYSFKAAQSPPCDDQIRPDVLPKDQVYAIICLANGGIHLEDFKLKSWQEAASVLWQVTSICARAEKAVQFEHRDLHWGNILLRRSDPLSNGLANLSLTPQKQTSPTKDDLSAPKSGIDVTLIDFTLSRATMQDGRILFDPFADECVFEGEGDYQFDVYRIMREVIGDNWSQYNPITNLIWLHYLSLKLLRSKKLKVPTISTPSSPFPSSPRSRSAVRPVRATATNRRARTLPVKSVQVLDTRVERREMEAYETLVRVEGMLKAVIDTLPPKRGKKGKKGKAPKSPLSSASDLLSSW